MDAIDFANRWVGLFLYPLTVLIAIVVFIEIILRYFFNHPTLWSFETTQFLFIICTMLCAGHLQLENGHVNVDIISSKFSDRTRLIVNLCTFPFFLLFIGAMTYFGFEFAFDSIAKMETTGSAWDPPVYPIKILLPVGAVLLLLQGIVNLIRQVRAIQK
jgi:TRAP-type mannitol/chloroaromatic compound transport system permease small subunit